MAGAPAIIASMKDLTRQRELRKVSRSLWYLATEYLGRDKLTVEFHKPMMDEMDRRRRLRAAGKYRKFEMEMWARDHYKTTVQEARCVQDFLIDPTDTLTWWHAVEDMALGSMTAVGKYFQDNKELRRLRPEMMPSIRAKKWSTAKGFRFSANKDRAPSMRAWGAGSEATGGHSRRGYLDDIIGYNDIEDNLMPKKRRWFARTALNVVSTGCPVFGSGTHWDSDDIYVDWRGSKDWDVRVRACYETDGEPDWSGQPVLFTRRDIERKRRGMTKFEFSCQMMNDPLPDSDRMWKQSECEHFISIKEAAGPGRVFILSDPAPRAVGSLSGVGEKARGDSSKDWWSIAVVKIVARRGRQQKVLLDGVHSQDWTASQGCDEACRLLGKWGTNLFFNEMYGGLGADYSDQMFEAAKRAGVSIYRDKKNRLPRFNDSHASGAKNNRFEKLCSEAENGDILICESVPEEFLYGDGGKTGALTQARNWRSLAKGRNTLKWDDDADVWSRCTDSALLEFAPALSQYDPFEEYLFGEDSDEPPQRSRYCAV
ncbi:MAG: hypothetical protein OES25_16905 [Acidobacteriota bacterium]|nr:hypothetical protein [Acidobacteriota bacterium]